MANLPTIPASRVPFIDERTGTISREWFLFLSSLLGTATTTGDDVQIGPESSALLEQIAELRKQIQDVELSIPQQVAPVPSVIDSLYINVKAEPYNAAGDGVTDDHAAIQAALTYATDNGGTVFFPAGTYVCGSPLTMNTGTSWARFAPRCSLLGASVGNTRILCPTASLDFLTIGGFGALYYLTISNIYFQGPGFVDEVGHPAVDLPGTGTGLTLLAGGDVSITECVFNGWGLGVHITESYTTLFVNTAITTNEAGILLDGSIYNYPNAMSFFGCSIGGNSVYGLMCTLGTTLNMTGGGVEGNGAGVGAGFHGGIFVSQGPNGVCAVSLTGIYFENNAGDADVYIDSNANSTANSISGCTFNRISNTQFVNNNIVTAAGATFTNNTIISGCGFRGFNTYVPNAARPYILYGGGGVANATWFSCYFDSPVETPPFPGLPGIAVANGSHNGGFLGADALGAVQLYLSGGPGGAPAGMLNLGSAVAAAATAGAGVLPATPAQFLVCYIGAVQYKIPLYNP